MRVLLPLVLLLSLPVQAELLEAKRFYNRIEKDARWTDTKSIVLDAITRIIDIATVELKKRGRGDLGFQMQAYWETEGRDNYFGSPAYGIGDHPNQVIWQKLNEWYLSVEFVLGREYTIRFHIADLYVLNNATKIAFSPKDFPMDGVEGSRADEYERNFCGHYSMGDEEFPGFAPVLSFWATYLSCLGGTGFVFVCGFAAEGVERVFGKYLCPKLSDKIMER